MREFAVDITRTEYVGNNTYLLELMKHELAGVLVPGQFLQLRTGSSTDPFLRRTVSVSGVDRRHGIIRLLIEVVGPGTRALCTGECGTSVNVIGPLGKGFDLSAVDDGQAILIAGGIGAAPLIFLARELVDAGRTDITFLMGGRHREGVRIVERFMPGAVNLNISTDDGSIGYHGLVTDLLIQQLETGLRPVLYSCGPKPMLQRVAEIAERGGLRCQVSLEERMACGIGACYGCAVERVDGSMARVCVDGPVFESDSIAWET